MKVFLLLLLPFVVNGCVNQDFFVRPVITENGQTKTVNRKFISHRGVDMSCTVAGENSLEAIAYAAAVGFDAIETDVRETSDGVLICLHDPTVNRTLFRVDREPIPEATPVETIPFDVLRRDYRIKATREHMRSQVPTLEEYLECCKDNGLLVFIEPKLRDAGGVNYSRIIETADRILGREGYIFTSNNFANDVLRNTLKISDVRIMTILYQTTYEAIQALGNSIMAISATRIKDDDYAAYVERAVADGFVTESSADKFPVFDKVNTARINYISTDWMLPDYKGQGTPKAEITSASPDFKVRSSRLRYVRFE